ncbi:MAG TPA: TPM domain-containing protein [Thermoanaerobaculia bacterium]
MKRFLLAILLVAATAVAALEVPPAPTQWVTDQAGILGGTEEDLLNRKLSDFEQSSGAQFIIYTLPSLQGDSPEEFSIRAVEQWKVGQKKYDNGLVIFVFVEEKLVRVEVGYGLEGTVTDAFSSRVIREYIGPRFAAGDYAGGLNAGADALIAKIRGGEAPVPPLQPRGAGQGQGGQQPAGDIPLPMIIIILFVIFFVIVPMFSRRRSGCSGCIFPFIFPGGGITMGGGGFGGGFGGGGFGGGGGFSGGGGSFGGGGATGGW